MIVVSGPFEQRPRGAWPSRCRFGAARFLFAPHDPPAPRPGRPAAATHDGAVQVAPPRVRRCGLDVRRRTEAVRRSGGNRTCAGVYRGLRCRTGDRDVGARFPDGALPGRRCTIALCSLHSFTQPCAASPSRSRGGPSQFSPSDFWPACSAPKRALHSRLQGAASSPPTSFNTAFKSPP